jgi:general secretion pathway protein B
MSYILDALKKAESDRLSGAAPIIGAPVERFLAPESPPPKRWLWVAVPLAAATVGVLVWLTAEPERVNDQPASVIAQIAPRAAMPALAPVTKPLPPSQASAPAPALMKKPAAVERTTPPEPVEKKTPLARSEARSAPEHKAAPAITTLALSPQVAPVQETLPFLHELPAQVQREIPKFTIGGYLYSGNKADRSLLVNRRLLHEGDQIAPGLVIEEMRPQEMVLNYRGTRYRSNY